MEDKEIRVLRAHLEKTAVHWFHDGACKQVRFLGIENDEDVAHLQGGTFVNLASAKAEEFVTIAPAIGDVEPQVFPLATILSLEISEHEPPERDWPCTVEFGPGTLLVKYFDETSDTPEVPVCYRGTEYGEGHYVLTCPEVDGRATLHRIKDSNFLEGYWTQSGFRGMWRIKLKDKMPGDF